MSNIFSGSKSLTKLNLKNFDTKKVTNMCWMFNGYSSLTKLNINNFDTNKVTNMSDMFYGC